MSHPPVLLTLPDAIAADLSRTKDGAQANRVEVRPRAGASEGQEVLLHSGSSGRVWKAPLVAAAGADRGNALQALALEEVVSNHTMDIATTLALVSFGAADGKLKGETMASVDALAKLHPAVPKEALVAALRTVAMLARKTGDDARYYQIRRDGALRHVRIESIPDNKKSAREEIATLAVKKLTHPDDLEDRTRFLPFADAETRDIFTSMTSGIMSGLGSKTKAGDDSTKKAADVEGEDGSDDEEEDDDKEDLYEKHNVQSNFRLPKTLKELELDDGVTWGGVAAQLAAAAKAIPAAEGFIGTKVARAKDITTREKYAQQLKQYEATHAVYSGTMVDALDAFQGISERAREWLETPAARNPACQNCRAEMRSWFHQNHAVAGKVSGVASRLHDAVGELRVLLCEVARLHNLGVLDGTW